MKWLSIKKENISGFLTRGDVKKLEEASRRKPSPLRKKSYTKWICKQCEQNFFYIVMKCPMCGSNKISETVQPTSYGLKNYAD